MDLIYLFLLEVLAGILVTMAFEYVLKSNKKLRNKYYRHNLLFWGYHVHHSIYGLISVVFSFINIFWLAFGLGIIIQHTLSDGRFVFIEKQKK